MPLRLMEVVLPQEHLQEVDELLKEEPLMQIWYDQISAQQTLLKNLATAEETEHLIDLFTQRFENEPWFRLILLPVAASVALKQSVRRNYFPAVERRTPCHS